MLLNVKNCVLTVLVIRIRAWDKAQLKHLENVLKNAEARVQ